MPEKLPHQIVNIYLRNYILFKRGFHGKTTEE